MSTVEYKTESSDISIAQGAFFKYAVAREVMHIIVIISFNNDDLLSQYLSYFQ